ncbi:hypothetical protein KAFR_0B01300 [Kazachstania africana CBS 2517]|uniref:HORMA domain-containing protein n=1 Tax=Kazachstania africana (strain ATCC 22294 / BCRC 22015 / CBS 2517 / CECT 1963 / NBRC 1671 / NRRL Y-8276) TaxID=1071382 RepID=H2APX9_KAZAF|nr:hypothetical protein KAFR_0B01300 [Kazachstania africana CBS 2517]CCF56429.1 hypothetical protein KAFR_0B01300 [Kazachstania africana CBS 2517]
MSTNQLVLTKQKPPATKTAITIEQSQKLVQTMLTMSFGCIAFLRGLFPDENFIDQRFVPEKVDKNYNKQTASHANSIKIKTLLRGKSKDADLLLDWLEKGVFQSVKLRYLKMLSLEIFLDEDNPAELIENYCFKFDYNFNDNSVSMKINDDKDSISLLDSRKMAQQLMRRFIIITQSLDPLPQKKFLNMKLMFNDSVDPDYQPTMFRDATFDKRATIQIPLSSNLESCSAGNLNTNFQKLNLNVYSAADNTTKEGTRQIDPFEIALDAEEEEQVQSQSILKAGSVQFVDSPTTNVLSKFLNSSQPSIQPTQKAFQNYTQEVGTRSTLGQIENSQGRCECSIPCTQSASSVKKCKLCKRELHGICYGNCGRPMVEACLTCLVGETHWGFKSDEFKDLMILRRCYRFMARKRGSVSSVLAFFEQVVPADLLDKEYMERIKFAVAVLFHDNIFTLEDDQNRKRTQTKRVSNSVMIDVDGGLLINYNKQLLKGERHIWNFSYTSPKAHSCYMDVFAKSTSQFEEWLQEIKELRLICKNPTSELPAMEKLAIDDDHDLNTQDPIIIRSKRKNIDLEQYLKDENSSLIISDTIDMKKQHDEPASKKIRKISVSKKTLKSIW